MYIFHCCNMADFVKVCRVGYALNAKKLRRSHAPVTSGAVTEDPVSSNHNQSKRKIDGSISRPWRGGGLADILETKPDIDEMQAVHFLPWEADKSLADSMDFQVIIHKLTEDIEREDGSERLQALDKYLLNFPHTVVVDPVQSVRMVTSRARCCQALRKIQLALGANCPFSQPSFMLAEKGHSDTEIIELLRTNNIRFPVICKPLEACGTPTSHTMVVIVSEEDLHMAAKPCVIQQYFDHNESFYKVYVIDQDVMVYRRPSLPDLTLQTRDGVATSSSSSTPAKVHSLVFDSRYSYPTWTDFTRETYSSDSSLLSQSPKVVGLKKTAPFAVPATPNGAAATSAQSGLHCTTPLLGTKQPVESMLPSEPTTIARKKAAVEDVSPNTALYSLSIGTANNADCDHIGDQFRLTAKAIKDEFGLTLFGFDVIIPSIAAEGGSEQPLLVIDVNYFPSYKEVPDFPSRLRKYLWRLAYP